MARELTLILGGARSGKSAYALAQTETAAGPVLFVATAEPLDEEMRERIARHRAERPPAWRTLEAPRNAGEAIRGAAQGAGVIVVDCLTLLISNALLSIGDSVDERSAEAATEREVEGILAASKESDAAWIVVSNEVGLGVVPPTPLGRAFRDALGRANQRVAAAADHVVLLVAGIAMRVK